MTPLLAKAIWLLGVVGWFVIRYPHDRRARRTLAVNWMRSSVAEGWLINSETRELLCLALIRAR